MENVACGNVLCKASAGVECPARVLPPSLCFSFSIMRWSVWSAYGAVWVENLLSYCHTLFSPIRFQNKIDFTLTSTVHLRFD